MALSIKCPNQECKHAYQVNETSPCFIVKFYILNRMFVYFQPIQILPSFNADCFQVSRMRSFAEKLLPPASIPFHQLRVNNLRRRLEFRQKLCEYVAESAILSSGRSLGQH